MSQAKSQKYIFMLLTVKLDKYYICFNILSINGVKKIMTNLIPPGGGGVNPCNHPMQPLTY